MHRQRHIVGLLTALAALLIGTTSCSKPVRLTESFSAAGKEGVIHIAREDHALLSSAVQTVRETIEHTCRMLDYALPESDIAKANRVADSARIPLSANTFRLVDLALHYAEQTRGAFDITLVPLDYLWGLKGDVAPEEEPASELIEAALASVGPQHVSLSDQGSIAFLSPQTRIDVGDLARSYAVDLSIINLRRAQLDNLLVQFDQAARCLGQPEKVRYWSVDVPNPFDAAARLGSVTLTGGYAAVSVRLNAKTFTIGDRRYSAMLNPRTGRPAEGTAGATVLGPTATQAHALAYAMVVLGLDGAAEILGNFQRCDVLIIPDEQPLSLWMTEGFAKAFTPASDVLGSLNLIERPPAPPEPAPVETGQEGQGAP